MKLKLYLFKKELFYFLLAHGLGIYVAVKLFPVLARTVVRTDSSGINLFLIAAVFLVIIVLFSILKKRAWFYRIFLILILYFGSQAVFAVFLNELNSYVAAGLVLVLLFITRSVLVQNWAVSLAIAGIGGILGLSFSPTTAIIILVVFSFYDIIAVYKTKHMVKMAEGMVKSGAIFGLIITSKKPKEFMILGSGDILLPLLLSASLVPVSIGAAIIVSGFSAGGLFITHLLFSNQKKRRPMAALPPVATLAVIGYLVSILLL